MSEFANEFLCANELLSYRSTIILRLQHELYVMNQTPPVHTGASAFFKEYSLRNEKIFS